MKNFFIAILILSPCTALSDLYKQIDESGNVTYSNIRSDEAKHLDLPPITVVPGIDSTTVEDKIKKRMESIKYGEHRETVKNKISEETKHLERLKTEYKGGTPDRLGNERNYQRYLDRVEQLNNEIAAREQNLKILGDELQQLPIPNR